MCARVCCIVCIVSLLGWAEGPWGKALAFAEVCVRVCVCVCVCVRACVRACVSHQCTI